MDEQRVIDLMRIFFAEMHTKLVTDVKEGSYRPEVLLVRAVLAYLTTGWSTASLMEGGIEAEGNVKSDSNISSTSLSTRITIVICFAIG